MQRAISKLLVAAVTALLAAPAFAQDYPTKPVRMLTGFAAGGAADIVGRIVAQPLSDALKQSFFVENRAGGSGVIATEAAARAAPDGYTLLVGSMTTHALAPTLNKKLPYDVVRDFSPVILLGNIPLVMSINPGIPANSVKEFVALAKASPGKYAFASAGDGSPPHLTGELFKYRMGVDLLHVPYKGTGPAVADLIAGQVALTIDGAPVQVPHIKSGKLRALAVAHDQRLAPIPDVPTFAEQGYSGMEVSLWYGIFAPANTPRPIIAKLNAELVRAMALPDVRKRFADLAVEPAGGTPEQFGAFQQSEIKRWAQVIQQAGMKLE